MGLLIRPMLRSREPELLDRACLDPVELRESLRDLERLNRYFGGTAVVLSELGRFLRSLNLRGAISIFDAGTGGADIPRAMARWARRRRVCMEIVACDYQEQVLEAAAEWSRDYPQISFVKCDVRNLSLPPGSFDLATCSLTAHHLSRPEVVSLLRQLEAVSRYGFILSDLERSRTAYAGVWLGTRLFSRNRLTRFDGPLSVLKGFTPQELRALAMEAGIRDLRVFRRPFFRIVAVRAKLSGSLPCGT